MYRSLIPRYTRPLRLTRPARVALGLLVMVSSVSAAPFRLVDSSVDGGGQHSQGARFSVEGSIGQPDVGRLQGQRFSIEGGFWRNRPAAQSDTIFSNRFEG